MVNRKIEVLEIGIFQVDPASREQFWSLKSAVVLDEHQAFST